MKDANSLPEFQASAEEYKSNPIGYLEDLSRQCPYAKSGRGYVILRRKEARPALQMDIPISVYHIPAETSPYLAERTKEPLLTRHGPEHVKLRMMLTRVLRERVIEDLRPRIRELFLGLLQPLLERGEGDLVADLFHPFPARVLAPMLGLPLADIEMVSGWVSSSSRWTNIYNPPDTLAEIEQAWRSLEAYLLELLRERRNNLGTDIFSELIREMEGHRELEVVGIAMELTRAGMDTTRRQLANTLHALITHPSEWEKLKANPGIAHRVVEEGMRFAGITHNLARAMIDDTTLDGLTVEKGETLTIMAMAVNRDPEVFADPGTFNAERSPCPHMSFGFGSHSCVGAPLARMEMTEAFTLLAERVDRFELVGDVPRSDVSTGLVPTKLPVRIFLKP